jgi:hypothetical protein
MGIFLLLTAIFIGKEMQIPCLVSMCMFVISYQSTTGTMFWIYATEVASSAALGLSLGMMMGTLTVLTFVAPSIIESCGIGNTFYSLAGFQLLVCVTLWIKMKETRGLSS